MSVETSNRSNQIKTFFAQKNDAEIIITTANRPAGKEKDASWALWCRSIAQPALTAAKVW